MVVLILWSAGAIFLLPGPGKDKRSFSVSYTSLELFSQKGGKRFAAIFIIRWKKL
jgi:hypothetical protein